MAHDRVTFLFTGIEGSTRLLQDLGDRYTALVNAHHDIVQTACTRHHVVRLEPSGDGFFALFASAADALEAAVDIQRALTGGAVRVRMGVYSVTDAEGSTAAMRLDMHRAGRIMNAGHGGQVLISEATRTALGEALPDGVSFRDLGTHQLKDLAQPEHLYQAVIAGLPAEFPPLRSVSARPHNLPLQLTTFVGREREMTELSRLMTLSRLVTLTGPGGAGKTRLALQVGAAALDNFLDGVWLIDLTPVQDPGLVVGAVAAALRLREQAGQKLLETVVAYLHDKILLVILDNCEHLIAAAADLADTLLRRASGVTVLATSREPLAVGGEQIFRVPPLALPDPRTDILEIISKSDAVRLFVDRASASFPEFMLANRNARAIAQICHRLDGMPLALELAAARVPALTPQEIALGLDDRFRLLTSGSRTATAKHQTLQAVVDWSHDLLTHTEQFLFRRLSVFSGGWTASAAAAVCAGDGLPAPAVLATLVRLVDRSLVTFQSQATGTRYAFLETVRAYAAERLGEAGETDALRHRTVEYFVGLAEQAEPHLRGPEQAMWLQRLDADHDNLRQALDWSRTADPELGLRLAAALFRFWRVRGYLTEGRTACERVLGASPDAPAALRTKVLHALGSLAYSLTDLTAARAYHTEGLTLARVLGDRAGIAAALNGLGIVASEQGNYAEARGLFEESLDIARELQDRRLIGSYLSNLGIVAYSQMDFPAAQRLLEESLTIQRETGDTREITLCLVNLGVIAMDMGDFLRSRALLEECLDLARRLRYPIAIAGSLVNLGNLACAEGDVRQAAAQLTESLELCVETGATEYVVESCQYIARLALEVKRPEHSARLLGWTATARDRLGMPARPPDRPQLDAMIAGARETIGLEAFDAAFADGRRMTQDQIVALARQVLTTAGGDTTLPKP